MPNFDNIHPDLTDDRLRLRDHESEWMHMPDPDEWVRGWYAARPGRVQPSFMEAHPDFHCGWEAAREIHDPHQEVDRIASMSGALLTC